MSLNDWRPVWIHSICNRPLPSINARFSRRFNVKDYRGVCPKCGDKLAEVDMVQGAARRVGCLGRLVVKVVK